MTLTDAEREAIEKARTWGGGSTGNRDDEILDALDDDADYGYALGYLSARAERDAEVAELRALLRDVRAEIEEQVSATDGDDPFGTSCPNCVAGMPVAHTVACRIDRILRPTPPPATTTDEQETTK